MPFFKKKNKDKTSKIIPSSAPSSDFFGLPSYEEVTFFDDINNLAIDPIFTLEEATSANPASNYIIQQSKLPVFNGSDPNGWLKAFKKEGILYNWTDSYKLQILHNCMKEKSIAEYWWDQHYKTSPPATFEEFEKQLIKDLFDPSDSASLSQSTLTETTNE